jgi:hypothetical protein
MSEPLETCADAMQRWRDEAELDGFYEYFVPPSADGLTAEQYARALAQAAVMATFMARFAKPAD